MIPNENGEYDEYMILEGELEKVGDWKTDLTNYITQDDLQTSINDLTTEINKKADIVYYPVKDEETGEIIQTPGTFLSPEDKEKLGALVIDKDGNVGISGSVNAENVEGLGTWLTENSSIYISGLTENNLGSDLLNKLNFITSVNTNIFNVENGKLNLISIDKSQVKGLEEALNEKASIEDINKINTSIESLQTVVSQLEQTLNSFEDSYVTQTIFDSTINDLTSLINTNTNNINTLSQQITVLDNHLTWGTMNE